MLFNCLPGTCLSSILVVEPSNLRSFPIKTRGIWVPGRHCFFLNPPSTVVVTHSLRFLLMTGGISSDGWNQVLIQVPGVVNQSPKKRLAHISCISNWKLQIWESLDLRTYTCIEIAVNYLLLCYLLVFIDFVT